MKWVTLRSFGNSRAVQMSALFPAIGYLILFNDEVARFLSAQGLESSYTGPFIEFLWRTKLHFIYFGLMSLGIGAAIYQVACPFIIKKHGDALDYIRIDGNSITPQHAEQIARQLGVEAFPPGQSKDYAIINLMRNHYSDRSRYKPTWRLVVTVLFGTGTALLAIPSVITAIKITASLLKKFTS